MIEYFLNPQLIEALGWTLLHSIWQGAAFAIALVLVLIALRSYSAQARYIVSVGILTAFLLTFSTTLWHQWHDANMRMELIATSTNEALTHDEFVLNNSTETLLESSNAQTNIFPENQEVLESNSYGMLTSFKDYYQRHLPLLVTIWFLGVLVLQLRFLGQLAYVQRLKHYGTQLFPDSWSAKIEELEGKLRIQKKVKYLTSGRVESPMVIGWLKPVILLPRQLLTSLTETEIYAVLAHELAHIRREDFLVNLLQTFLCNVFFFHPGVWWMSNRIDDEREHCCDDLAVAATGPATSYAKTLINVSELQLKLQNNAPLAMALSGKTKKRERGGFTDRIKRLFMANNGAGSFREGFATAIILVTALFLGVAATSSTVGENTAGLSQEIRESESNTSADAPNDLDTDLSNPSNEINPISEVDQADVAELPVAPPVEPAPPVQPESERTVTPVTKKMDNKDEAQKANVDGRTALHIASAKGQTEEMLRLINLDADINAQDAQGRTPLMYAAAAGQGSAVALLVSRLADVNIADEDGNRAFELARARGYTDLTDFLALITEKNPFKALNKAHIKAEAKNNALQEVDEKADVMEDIREEEKRLKKELEKQQQSLISEIIKETQEAVEETVQREVFDRETFHVAAEGTHLRQYNLKKATPAIVEIARNGTIQDLRQLLHNELDINAADATGQTALMAAASSNRLDIAKVLIQNLADVDRSSASGLTALHYAALENHDEMAKLLLRNRAKVDPTMQYSITGSNFKKEPLVWEYIGATPLLVAIEAGNTKVISVLIEAGADKYKSLTRNEFRLMKNRRSYTKGGDVIIDKDFFKNVTSQTSDDTWTPFKHALSINKPEILALLK